MSLADEPESTVPPDPLDPAAAPAEPASSDVPDEPTTGKKGRKKKEKKEKKKREKREKVVADSSDEDTPKRKFKLSDLSVYAVMLMIAFGFLLFGCVLLWIELSRYGFDFRARG